MSKDIENKRQKLNGPEPEIKKVLEKTSGFKVMDTIITAPNGLWSVAISKNDKMIATGDNSSEGKVRIFSVNGESNTELKFKLEKEEKLHSATIQCLVFSDDDRHLLSCSDDETIVLSDANTLQKIKTFLGHIDDVNSVFFKSENEIVSCSWDDNIIVWDINSGNPIGFVNTGNSCLSLALSPNKEMIVVGQRGGNIMAYESTIFKEIFNHALRKITDLPKKHSMITWTLCFTPNGKKLAAFSSDGTINVYEVLSNKKFNHLRTLKGHTSWVYGGAISPNGEIIASSSYDKTIKLWDINTGDCVQTIRSHTDAVVQVAFSHSGSFLASVGHDCTLRITVNEDVAKLRNEKVCVILSLAKSTIFIPADICQEYLEFVNAVHFKYSMG